ncbi:unnamed protein product, partial [Mycena citricolor]
DVVQLKQRADDRHLRERADHRLRVPERVHRRRARADRRREADICRDQVRAERRGAEVLAPQQRRRVAADERVVLRPGLEVACGVDERGQADAEDQVRVVEHRGVPERRGEAEVRRVHALRAARRVDEAGVDRERLGVDAVGGVIVAMIFFVLPGLSVNVLCVLNETLA